MFWAEGGVTLAADLMNAAEDPRPVAAQLPDRAFPQLPPGVVKVHCRWAAGYFAANLAKHCHKKDIEFAVGVKRNTAVVRAAGSAPTAGWHPAKDMNHTEVAVIDYLPGRGLAPFCDGTHKLTRTRPPLSDTVAPNRCRPSRSGGDQTK